MKLKAVLLCSALWMPNVAKAEPVSAFIIGITGGAGLFASGTVASAAFSAGAFLGTTVVGSLLLNVGVSALLARFAKRDAPSIADARYNTRLEDAVRWVAGGEVNIGGAAGMFLEFDGDGNFWYIVAHADAEQTGGLAAVEYVLDGVPVTLSDGLDEFEFGDVLTDAFCLTGDGSVYEGRGERIPVWRIYTVTPSAAKLAGDLPAPFVDAFENLPADFYGAGVCFSIIRGKPLQPDSRFNGYRWRGPIGIGEPSVAIVSSFGRGYDPRKAGDVDDPVTWPALDGNPALMWAWFRTSPRGRGVDVSEINWDLTAKAADICDIPILDRSGNSAPQYRCGVAFPDSKSRFECEKEILETFDAFVAYDDEGRAYPVAGSYELPTLEVTAARDIFTAETQTVDDGENPMDGVVVEYISPEHGYTKQPCAPWRNPAHFDPAREPNYLKVPVLGCKNHRQAVTLAKAIGLREQPARRGAYGAGIKGILAKNERAIMLRHDAEFDGPHEIVTPVIEGKEGYTTSFVVVPLQQDRWTLLEGEEGEPPQPTPVLNIDNSLELAENVQAAPDIVATSGGAAVRFRVVFDAPSRVDRLYRFRYVRDGIEQYFAVDMDQLLAVSAIVGDGEEFRISWQTVTGGGRATVWSDERDDPEFLDVVATANNTPPFDLSNFAVTDVTGAARVSFETRNDENLSRVRLYQSQTNNFDDAEVLTTEVVVANSSYFFDFDGLDGGAIRFWARPFNQSSMPGDVQGPETAAVT